MPKIAKCPFCGKKPNGKKFCSTDNGPALMCNHCLADGPPAFEPEETWIGIDEQKSYPKAIRKWNARAS